ncbi:MAG: hypothetical protein RL685_1732 [Pseudomonadota bacterium]
MARLCLMTPRDLVRIELSFGARSASEILPKRKASARAEQKRPDDVWREQRRGGYARFGIAPLMKVVRGELGLTEVQVKNSIIASKAITIGARLITGGLCDRFGPRLTERRSSAQGL